MTTKACTRASPGSISPFDEVTDFAIDLTVPAHPELSGKVQPPELLLHPRYQLAGTVDAGGNFRSA